MPEQNALQNTVGAVVRTHREAQGLTQKALAQRCQLSPVYISQIEKGERRPSLPVCRALAAALGCPPQLLVLHAYRATVPAELHELLHHGGTATLDDPVVQEFLPLVAALRPLPGATRRHLLRIWQATVALVQRVEPQAPQDREVPEQVEAYTPTLYY
jgi:transcriptional regulator with XRE-family HTH domain